jgi:hypothetical protein
MSGTELLYGGIALVGAFVLLVVVLIAIGIGTADKGVPLEKIDRGDEIVISARMRNATQSQANIEAWERSGKSANR